MTNHPIHLADPHQGVPPCAYVILKKRCLCLTCGTPQEWSETYAKTNLKKIIRREDGTTTTIGSYVTNLRPLDRPQYNLPIQTIEREMPPIPFCHRCGGASLSHLPPAPSPRDKEIINRFAGTAQPDKPKPTPKPTHRTTLKDLENLL